MNKICTDINQTKKLIELGFDIDTVDLTVLDLPIQNGDRFKFIQNKLPGDIFPSITDGKSEKIPAWSLSALLELMPKELEDDLELYYGAFGSDGEYNPIWVCSCMNYVNFGDTPVDAVFNVLCLLLENKKL